MWNSDESAALYAIFDRRVHQKKIFLTILFGQRNLLNKIKE